MVTSIITLLDPNLCVAGTFSDHELAIKPWQPTSSEVERPRMHWVGRYCLLNHERFDVTWSLRISAPCAIRKKRPELVHRASIPCRDTLC